MHRRRPPPGHGATELGHDDALAEIPGPLRDRGQVRGPPESLDDEGDDRGLAVGEQGVGDL